MKSNRATQTGSGFMTKSKKSVVSDSLAPSIYSQTDWQSVAGFYKEVHKIRRILESKLDSHLTKQDMPLNPDYGPSPIQLKFQALAAEWREATDHLSSVRDKCVHPAYQQIIGMGPDVLALVFGELRGKGGFWFWALRALTGENPVPESAKGRFDLIRAAWIRWAEARGY